MPCTYDYRYLRYVCHLVDDLYNLSAAINVISVFSKYLSYKVADKKQSIKKE